MSLVHGKSKMHPLMLIKIKIFINTRKNIRIKAKMVKAIEKRIIVKKLINLIKKSKIFYYHF